ncbi:unnamed protein product [Mytilus coruscus]|uniref:Uncharacterized protein n=1 Tax=Mytilus coruscus TaxID=42192 RepID=A0A6J8A7L4_MYTCO|nr:unnamed protein product [Mytilus coruscus]
MSTSGDKTVSKEPSAAYNNEDDKSDTESDMSSITLYTEDTDREQDDSEDEDEMKTILDDMTSIENASKQVHSCMEGIMKAKKHYLEKEKEAYDKLDDIRRELTCFKEEREEQTSLSLEYVIAVYNRTEKLRHLTHGVLDILLPIMKCGEEATIAIEEERKKTDARSGYNTFKKYNKSIKKLKREVKQRHKEQIEKVQETNWNKYIENIENAKTDIRKHYDTEIEKAQTINAKLRSKLKEVNDRFDTEIKEKETENWEKYKEELNKMKQQITDKYNSKIEELSLENSSLHENIEKIQKSVVPKIENDYKEALKEVEEKAKQHYHEKVQHLKNKFDTTIEEILRTTERRTNKASDESSKRVMILCRPDLELQAYKSKTEELEIENMILQDKNRKQKDGEKKWIHQMNQEIQDLRLTVDELQKENEMLNATVDEKVSENLRLDTELQTLTKEKERITVDKTVTTLQTEMEELRKELIDKHLLIDQAHKTLSRSKSLCDLSHSEEEIKIRSNMLKRMGRENKEEQQQISKDYAETLYECTGKSKSLQSLTQTFKNDDRLQKDEIGMFDSAEDLTEREMTAQDILKKLSKASKTTTTVQNNYNIITSNATFQKDCLVEAITATPNSDRSITNS